MARKGQGIEIVSGWQAGLGGEDFLRGLVERVVQQVLEAEMTSFLGAETYQRTGERSGWRNGYKPRTLKTRVGGQQRPLVLRLMKTITESATREAAKAALAAAIVEFEKKAPKVARLLEEHGEEILGVYALPEAHRKRMRTTNMLERQNQELKRRTRVVRIFPNEQSCLRLVSALLIETSQEWMGRVYLRMDEDTGTETHAQAA